MPTKFFLHILQFFTLGTVKKIPLQIKVYHKENNLIYMYIYYLFKISSYHRLVSSDSRV